MLHLTLYELARYEPDTIPSERFNRLVLHFLDEGR